ncbi:hypothetical protein BpHYR1_037303 [Brachionus plicatilis]|uniref:Uncharacterized protein n=1 Tax=Brachionus plicatilis TaxID=10195 RepID=A0A3M7RYH9_BRAPC|nr:hypothetical protein BpHYR1_037303 [Brachionus plicatilis]
MSSGFTLLKATAVQVLRRTTCPNLALPFTMQYEVTVLTPVRTTNGLLVALSSLPSALALALWNKRALLSFLFSGLYLSKSLNS